MSPPKEWHRTPVGLGKPAEASVLELQDEETTTYDPRRNAPPPVRPTEPSTVSLSPNDSDVEILSRPEERVFDLSTPLTSLLTPPRPRPSLARWLVSRLLFLVIVALVVLLGAAELSVALHEPRLDPRPLLAKGARFIGVKIQLPH